MNIEPGKIYQSIINIMNETEAISKARTNPQQGYKFRGIDDIYNALHSLFAKHGVFITSEVISENREERQTAKGGILLYSILTVKFLFLASDGSSVSCTTKGEAMDSGDKATNKAMSAALKYALMQMLLIPTEEEKDTEANTPQPQPKPAPAAKPIPADSPLSSCPDDLKAKFSEGKWTGKEIMQVFTVSGNSWEKVKGLGEFTQWDKAVMLDMTKQEATA